MNSDIVVLIPHYNNLTGLRNSLESIKFPGKIDVLIVDDGSSMKPDLEQMNKEFAHQLNLHLLFNKQNQGIETTLNNGLSYILNHIPAKYIARLDCGDICAPDRFTKQKAFLDTNEDVYLLGSWVEFFYEDKSLYTYKAPTHHHDIKNNMFLKCSFIHPSVMFRTAALKETGLYPLQYEAAEDYALFFQFVRKFKTHILPEVLTFCEMNPKGISRTKRSVQLKSKIKIILENRGLSPYFLLGLGRGFLLFLMPYSVVAKAKAIFLK